MHDVVAQHPELADKITATILEGMSIGVGEVGVAVMQLLADNDTERLANVIADAKQGLVN